MAWHFRRFASIESNHCDGGLFSAFSDSYLFDIVVSLRKRNATFLLLYFKSTFDSEQTVLGGSRENVEEG